MSKITNDGLTRSVTEYFIAVPIWQPVDVRGTSPASQVLRRRRTVYYDIASRPRCIARCGKLSSRHRVNAAVL